MNRENIISRLKCRRLRSHVTESEDGVRLTDYLASHFRRFDRAGWEAEIAAGRVEVNGAVLPGPTVLRRHDCVAYRPPETPEPEADMRFRTVYLDDAVAVFAKSGNLCVHPTGPFFRHTLWHAACGTLGELRFITRPDRETSGLVLAARTREDAATLEHSLPEFRKEYLAAVRGDFPAPLRAVGTLVPDDGSTVAKKKRFVPGDGGGPGRVDTEFFPLRRAGGMTLLRTVLHTGRQHQIRATLFSLGYPVVGDKLYGRDERMFLKLRERTLTGEDLKFLGMERQALHCSLLEFPHPRSGKRMIFRDEDAVFPELFPADEASGG